jgi:hypothetical protein
VGGGIADLDEVSGRWWLLGGECGLGGELTRAVSSAGDKSAIERRCLGAKGEV